MGKKMKYFALCSLLCSLNAIGSQKLPSQTVSLRNHCASRLCVTYKNEKQWSLTQAVAPTSYENVHLPLNPNNSIVIDWTEQNQKTVLALGQWNNTDVVFYPAIDIFLNGELKSTLRPSIENLTISSDQ
jgi:hypothetical protein